MSTYNCELRNKVKALGQHYVFEPYYNREVKVNPSFFSFFMIAFSAVLEDEPEDDDLFETEFRQYKRTYYMTKMGVEVVSE